MEGKDPQTTHIEDDMSHNDDFQTEKGLQRRKELRDAEEMRRIAPDIPIKEALEAHLDEDEKHVRRIRRRVDLRLVAMLSLIYTFAFIDRGNLGNANIAGMNVDLKLGIGNRYSILTMIFFIGYIIVDIPATILIRKVGPVVWIPSIALAWGVVTIGQGFVKTWGQMAVCRILLGTFEGGLIPGAIYLLGVWYTRFEIQKRFAGFYVLGIASSGLSGLLAYGLEKMAGDAGIAGWRWIFIIEGVISCVIAISAYFVIIDFPDKATQRNALGLPAFLTPEDAAVILARIERDRGDTVVQKLTFKLLLAGLKDWKIWETSCYVMLNNVALYAFSYFLPTILNSGFGFSVAKSQLYTLPPYAVAVPWILLCAWFGDKFRIRGPIIIFNACLYIIGISIVGYCKNVHARYGGVFLGVAGITGNIPTNFGYQHNIMVGQSKRALVAASTTILGGLGGIISGNIFLAKDAPGYRPALISCMCFQALTILLVIKNFFIFSRANRKADRGEMIIEGQPGFRYTL
ncbi:hypothetical protein MMC08_004614 [Hypocenomyce scalaris]|nr:hypothetical protein [Hypocenomyce scalaris]